jgi:chromosome segregation protein
VQKTETERSIETLDGRRAEIGNRLGTLEAGLKEKRRLLHGSQESESGLNARLTEARLSVERIDERLRSTYKLAHDDPSAERFPLDSNWEEIAAHVEELRSKIEALGPVNLYAIEEYERLEERHTFLVKEQEDLVNAKASLLKAISKINRTSRELFKDTFERIRESFRELFTALFGGGKADLILEDESDLLECGIEIVASPPGKKLQSISLLSGGEKAMTAICLLFAIFQVKPSPFCILDEMDAALDEPNNVRFNDTLREFVKRSQFIIITHNKRTMEVAETLYGVTMEERGISSVVSVDFDGVEKVLRNRAASERVPVPSEVSPN